MLLKKAVPPFSARNGYWVFILHGNILPALCLTLLLVFIRLWQSPHILPSLTSRFKLQLRDGIAAAAVVDAK